MPVQSRHVPISGNTHYLYIMKIVKNGGKYTLQNENGTTVPAFIISANDWVMREHLQKFKLDVHTEGNLDAYYGDWLRQAMASLD